MKNIRQNDVGRLCLVRFDDIGRQEALIIEINPEDKDLRIFSFATRSLQRVQYDMIVEINDYIIPNFSK